MSKTKIEGLRLFEHCSPFKDRFGSILDGEGPWTSEMLDRASDYPDQCGLWVWEGSCEVTTYEEEDGYQDYEFTGSYRRPTAEEMQRLSEGRFPLRGHEMPTWEQPEDFAP